jgi:hypothetical protein
MKVVESLYICSKHVSNHFLISFLVFFPFEFSLPEAWSWILSAARWSSNPKNTAVNTDCIALMTSTRVINSVWIDVGFWGV